MSDYEVTVTAGDGKVCFSGRLAPPAWAARDAQEFADDLGRCLIPGHVVSVTGARDEGRAES